MNTRDRLKRIINDALNGCPSYISEKIADALISQGVQLPEDDEYG